MNGELIKDIKELKGRKWLSFIMILVAAVTYGYFLTHSTIGMDDTAIERYFIEGWAPHVGRWTLYLLNLVLDFAYFTPYFMDIIGVMLLCLSAYLFCVLLYRVSGRNVSTMSLVAFATVYITYPLVGEVYIYYLHNGISLSFCLMALLGLAWWEYLSKGKWKQIIWVTLFLSLAIGCYESFALVYMVLICGIYMLAIIKDTLEKKKFLPWLKDAALAVVPLLLSMIIRKIMYTLINVSLGLGTDARDMSKLELWLVNNPLVILKDLLHQLAVRYVINGEFIFAIKIYVITTMVFVVAMLVYTILKKKWSLLFWGSMILITPWLLIIVELVITPYRAAQAIMLFVPWAWFICYEFLRCIRRPKVHRVTQIIMVAVLSVVVFRQGFELHHYFYFDYMKDQYNREYCHELAYDLYSNYDTENKPVIFIGQREMPQALRENVYQNVADVKLVHSNYVDEYGYRIWDIGCSDMIAWSTWADLGDGEYEIYRYMEMLGYDFIQPSAEVRLELVKEATGEFNYPVWPQAGSVIETDDYICVYMGPVTVSL